MRDARSAGDGGGDHLRQAVTANDAAATCPTRLPFRPSAVAMQTRAPRLGLGPVAEWLSTRGGGTDRYPGSIPGRATNFPKMPAAAPFGNALFSFTGAC
jgi:hypothetical protein